MSKISHKMFDAAMHWLATHERGEALIGRPRYIEHTRPAHIDED